MALPDGLLTASLCPGSTAREFGVYDLDGKPLGGDDHLWPASAHAFQLGGLPGTVSPEQFSFYQ